jgi:hypothetical protein
LHMSRNAFSLTTVWEHWTDRSMDGDSPTVQKIFWYGKRLDGHIRNTFLSLFLSIGYAIHQKVDANGDNERFYHIFLKELGVLPFIKKEEVKYNNLRIKNLSQNRLQQPKNTKSKPEQASTGGKK